MVSGLLTFHGGTTATSINSILSMVDGGVGACVLAPAKSGAMPALCELRGVTFDSNNNLYVANGYKDFNQILVFSPPSGTGQTWTFSGVYCGGKDSQLSHPFDVVFGPDGHLYVSSQDTNQITYYEGPAMKHPGTLKGVFAGSFTTLRG